MNYDIIVIGAGIAGASVAAELAKARKVLLVEREAQPGPARLRQQASRERRVQRMFGKGQAGPRPQVTPPTL